MSKPWEAMYRALVRRVAEITVEGQQRDRYAILRALEEVATCHTGLLEDYDKDRDE